jgi:hypothetical protein
MALVQLAGYAAFILASLVLGSRLILLWRRTREIPELVVGGSFLLAGVLGYSAWLVMGIAVGAGAEPATIKKIVIVGLGFTVIGGLCNGYGTSLIFRAGQRWAKVWVTCMGAVLVASWWMYVVSGPEGSATAFWRTVVASAPLHIWAATEAFMLGHMLRKRARLGLAQPMVANRTMQFGNCSSAVVVSIVVSYSAYLVYGMTPPVWTATLASTCLLAGAIAIWLGFFPPSGYRARVERALGAE